MQIRLNSVKFDYQVLVFLDTTLREDKELACLYVSSIVRNRHSVFICVGVVSSSSAFVSSNQPNEKILLYDKKAQRVLFTWSQSSPVFEANLGQVYVSLDRIYPFENAHTYTRVSEMLLFVSSAEPAHTRTPRTCPASS